MRPVERKVEEVVDDVDRGCGRAEREERDHTAQDDVDVEIFVRQCHRHEDQHVLHPLVHAQHLQQRLDAGLRRFDQPRLMAFLPARRVAVRRHDDRLARRVEDLQVGAAVANIVEAGFAVALDQRRLLGRGGQVQRRAGGDDRIEETEMVCDRIREFRRRRRREHDLAAFMLRIVDQLEDFGPIRQRRRIEFNPAGDLAFEPRLAARQPHRNHEQVERILPDQQEQAFPQQIRGDQRPVEVDGERNGSAVRPRIHVFRIPAQSANVGKSDTANCAT